MWVRASRQVLDQVRGAGAPLATGFTGQMHGAVCVDGGGHVIRPAILWNDQRTEAECNEITQLVGPDRLLAIAGNPALTGFQAPKLVWLLRHEPQSYARIARVFLPKDFVRWRLMGEIATDASDASGTLLLDLRSRDWSTALLRALDMPQDWFPPVVEGTELPGAGDNAAAAVAGGLVGPGPVGASIGTSGVLFIPTAGREIDASGRLHAFCHAMPDSYHLMGVALSSGGSLRWWRDLVGSAGYEEMVAAAAAVGPGAGGLVFLPYLTGERTPHLDPAARGAFFGLTASHRQEHLTRALMEGVVFSLRDTLEAARGLGVQTREIRATGGGSRSPLWRRLLADILALPVRRTAADEGAAYGAALLAGVAAGVWQDVGEAVSLVPLLPEITDPDARAVALYDELYGVYRSLYPATKGAMHRLHELARGDQADR